MARKARNNKTRIPSTTSHLFEPKYLLLLSLVGASRAITSQYLSPIFGSLIVHTPLVIFFEIISYVLVILVWNLSQYGIGSANKYGTLSIDILALLGSLQVIYIERAVNYGSGLGPIYGILAARLLSCIILTSQAVLQPVIQESQSNVPRQDKGIPSVVKIIFISCAARAFILLIELLTLWLLESLHAGLVLGSPLNFLLIVSLLFATTITRRSLLAFAIASCIVSVAITSQFWSLNGINGVIQGEGFKVLDRQHSITGYISVLENTKIGYQALRCDHSLLGGEWTRYPKHLKLKLREPVYAVFVTLEAVRLIDDEEYHSVRPPVDQEALIIGLGVGTSATAFIYHGIPTTIVEIDPVVHEYATKYFALPTNHTGIIGDALAFVHEHHKGERDKYDYIIHDVFTGGAEPLELFTFDFIRKLAGLLREDGVIAINYAGDLLQPSAASVVTTALKIFPSCRLFRETAPQSTSNSQDMANMVIFCRKKAGRFKFRQPTEADLLGSRAREEHLMPEFEVEASRFAKGNIINGTSIGTLQRSQRANAKNHWYFMRNSIPAKVWENY